MVTITCDVCKKKVEDFNPGRNFFYYSNFSVCEDCKDSLEYQIKPQVRAKEPYTFDWYDKVLHDTFGKAVQKGKA